MSEETKHKSYAAGFVIKRVLRIFLHNVIWPGVYAATLAFFALHVIFNSTYAVDIDNLTAAATLPTVLVFTSSLTFEEAKTAENRIVAAAWLYGLAYIMFVLRELAAGFWDGSGGITPRKWFGGKYAGTIDVVTLIRFVFSSVAFALVIIAIFIDKAVYSFGTKDPAAGFITRWYLNEMSVVWYLAIGLYAGGILFSVLELVTNVPCLWGGYQFSVKEAAEIGYTDETATPLFSSAPASSSETVSSGIQNAALSFQSHQAESPAASSFVNALTRNNELHPHGYGYVRK